MTPKIPPSHFWPIGFATDYVSMHADFVYSRQASKVSIRPAGWWHDLGYYLGAIVHPDMPGDRLRMLRRRPNWKRSERQRKAIDVQFYAHLRQIGVDRWYAWLMYQAVRRLGGRRYWLPDAHWSEVTHWSEV